MVDPASYRGWDQCQRCGYPWNHHLNKTGGCPLVQKGIINGWSAYKTFVGEKPEGIKGWEDPMDTENPKPIKRTKGVRIYRNAPSTVRFWWPRWCDGWHRDFYWHKWVFRFNEDASKSYGYTFWQWIWELIHG